MSTNKTFLSQLFKEMTDAFDLEELKSLCFQLDVDFDSLRGEGKESRVRELVQFMGRQNRLPTLLEVVKVDRPETNWPPIPTDFRYAPEQMREDRLPQSTMPAPTFNLGDIQASIVNVGGEQTISGPVSVDMREVSDGRELSLPAQIKQTRNQLEVGNIDNQKANILMIDLLDQVEQLPKAEEAQAKKLMTRLQALFMELQEEPPDQEMLTLTVQSLKRAATKLKAGQSELLTLTDLLAKRIL